MVDLIPLGNIREPARTLINNVILSGGGGGGGTTPTPTPNTVLGYFSPEDYGATGAGSSHDDYAGVQGAVNAALAAGGGTVYLYPERTYYMSTRLDIDPSRITILGNSARLDYSLKSFTDPASVTDITTNGGFSGSTGWTNSGNTNNTITYGSSTVSAPAAAGVTTGLYSEFGQQIAAVAGKTYRVTMTVVSITQITVGANTPRDIGVSFRPSGVGNGGSGGTLRFARNTDNEYTTTKVWVWDVVSPYTNPYLTIQSNCGFEIDSISIRELPDNTCVLIRTPSTGNLRGHNYHEIRDLKIRGKSGSGSYVDGIVFDTAVDGFSSRVNFYNVDVSDNIGRGLVFQNRAYLMNFYSCRIVASEACIDTLESASDAGENIAFIGGNIGGSKVGIRNRGMAMRFYSTSNDFSRQFYSGFGDVEIYGGWMETNQHASTDPSTWADWANVQYRFDVTGGTFKCFGGLIQVDGSTTPQAEAIFRIAKNAVVDLDKINVYNLHTTSGAIAIGEGRISASFRGGVNKEVENVLIRNQGGRVLSGEDANLTLNAWLTSTSKQKQPDRRTVQWWLTRAFTATLARGSNVLTVTDTTGLANGNTVEGVGIVPNSTIVSFVANTSVTLSNPVYGNGSQSLTGYANSPYATATLALDTSVVRTGTRSIKVTKNGIGSTDLIANIAIPVPAARAVGGELYLKVAAIPGSTSVPYLFFDVSFVALGAADADGVPVISNTAQNITSQNVTVVFDTGLDWTRLAWRSTRVDLSTAHDGYSPDWATHMLISFNMASLPNGTTFYIDDLVASVM